MRIITIVFILLSLTANFIFDSLPVLLLSMLSLPLLLWLLLTKKKKTLSNLKPDVHATEQRRTTSQTSQ
jgi:hypothetical protein